MKKNNFFTIKIAGCILFLGVFMFNMLVVLKKDADDSNLSLSGLSANAQITHESGNSWLGDGWDNLWNLDYEPNYVDCYTTVKANGSVSDDISFGVELQICGQKTECDSGDNDTCTETACPCGGQGS